jgi:histone acetyltransferase (RNA polymerase elongator complex component)
VGVGISCIQKYSSGNQIRWYLHYEIKNLCILANEPNGKNAKELLETIEDKDINVISKIYNCPEVRCIVCDMGKDLDTTRAYVLPRLQTILSDTK